MIKQKAVCLLCKHEFYHYSSQPRKYCDECMNRESEKTCICCGSPFTRKQNETMPRFLERNVCDECSQQVDDYSTTGEEGKIFRSLVLGPVDASKLPPAPDTLEDIIKDNCARFRLYFLYRLLIPYNDNIPLEDKLPSTQIYLLDILRRIRNIEEAIHISKKVREKIFVPVDKWETGPTDDDIRKLELTEIIIK